MERVRKVCFVEKADALAQSLFASGHIADDGFWIALLGVTELNPTFPIWVQAENRRIGVRCQIITRVGERFRVHIGALNKSVGF